jgi:hypothetical protein
MWEAGVYDFIGPLGRSDGLRKETLEAGEGQKVLVDLK